MSVTIDEFVPLESGDRLTRAEFHRRYSARPDIAKAELIEGVVYVAAPVRAGVHGTPDSLIHWWLNGYAAGVPGLQVASNSTVVLGDQSEVQPDACLYWQPWTGAGSRLTDDGYLDGAPLLVAEVAASRSSYDLHDKLEAYRRAGVAEYVVWQVLEKRIVWFQLRDGQYVQRQPDEDGLIESGVFPGLRLAVSAMLAGDRAGILAALDAGD